MVEEDEILEDVPVNGDGEESGRFEKLLDSDAHEFRLSGMFKDWYLDYASYVILHRAVPDIVDGLKPVQRRVLHAMFNMDDGKYTKVANIVGQAMQFHPHGDASILGALPAGPEGLRHRLPGKLGKHPHRRLQRRRTIHRGASVQVRQGSGLRSEGHGMDDLLRRKEPRTRRAAGALPAAARPGHGGHRRRTRIQNTPPQLQRAHRRLRGHTRGPQL